MGKATAYCAICGRILREEEPDRAREPGCATCRPVPPTAIPEARSTGTRSRLFSLIRSARSKEAENPLAGILLNAALVAVGAAILVVVTPGESADPRGRLESALSNIQKIRESDPAYFRAAEVLTLYDAAAGMAGPKRAEVDRLRENYFRELRRNARE